MGRNRRAMPPRLSPGAPPAQAGSSAPARCRQIGLEYQGQKLLVVGVLNGAFIFTADLVRRGAGGPTNRTPAPAPDAHLLRCCPAPLTSCMPAGSLQQAHPAAVTGRAVQVRCIQPHVLDMRVDFIRASSYGSASASDGAVRVDQIGDEGRWQGWHVLLVRARSSAGGCRSCVACGAPHAQCRARPPIMPPAGLVGALLASPALSLPPHPPARPPPPQHLPACMCALQVEDIIDSGHTIKRLGEVFASAGAASVRFACLLDKKGRRQVSTRLPACLGEGERSARGGGTLSLRVQ